MPVKRCSTYKFSKKSFVAARSGKLEAHYDIDEENGLIGRGTVSRIFACKHKISGDERAVKIIPKCRRNEDYNQQCLREFKLLQELDHPNILHVHEFFESETHFYLVMSRCRGGELRDSIIEENGFTEQGTALFMNTLLGAVNYLNENFITHLGLKPENIMLENVREVEGMKIVDFGNAIFTKENIHRDGYIGTPEYMSPEILEEELYGPKCDIWACGVIAYQILVGFLPFYGENDTETLDEIRYSVASFDDVAWEDVSSEAKDFVKMLLDVNYKTRPTAKEALEHPWIKKVRRGAVERLSYQDSAFAMAALDNMKKFNAQSKLKQATMSLISSQLIIAEEKEEIQKIFNALDTESDGRLSKEEVQYGFKNFFHIDMTNEEVDEMFERCDVNENGFLEFSEFVVATMNEANLFSFDKVNNAFDLLDVDGTGCLSAENLTEVLSFFLGTEKDDGLKQYVTNKVLKQVGKKKGETISFEEFMDMMLADTTEVDISTKEDTPPVKEVTPMKEGRPGVARSGSGSKVRDQVRRMSLVENKPDPMCMPVTRVRRKTITSSSTRTQRPIMRTKSKGACLKMAGHQKLFKSYQTLFEGNEKKGSIPLQPKQYSIT